MDGICEEGELNAVFELTKHKVINALDYIALCLFKYIDIFITNEYNSNIKI